MRIGESAVDLAPGSQAVVWDRYRFVDTDSAPAATTSGACNSRKLNVPVSEAIATSGTGRTGGIGSNLQLVHGCRSSVRPCGPAGKDLPTVIGGGDIPPVIPRQMQYFD